MRYLKTIFEILKNDDIIEKRDNIISDLIKYKDCCKYELFGFNFYTDVSLTNW